jgi:hypothetical protein
MLIVGFQGGGGGSNATELQGNAVSASAVTEGQLFVGTAAGTYGPVTASGDVAFSVSAPGQSQLAALSAATITPSTDVATTIGTTAKRLASLIVGTAVSLYSAASAANPVAQLTANGLSVGQGGSNAVSAGIASGGANTLAFTNGASTNWATLTSSALTFVNATTITASSGNLTLNSTSGSLAFQIAGSTLLTLTSGSFGWSTGGAIVSSQYQSPTGNNLVINSAASLYLRQGGLHMIAFESEGLELGQATSVSVASTGNTTLASTAYQYIVISVSAVSLTGNVTITFPSNNGSNGAGTWFLDLSAVTFGAFTISIKCGTGTAATTISATSVKLGWIVCCNAANSCVLY